MTLERIIEKLETVAQDVDYVVLDKRIDVTILDFDGFTEDWEEVERELEDEEGVDELLDWLEEQADEIEGDYYKDFHFGEYTVTVGYASFDI